MDTVFYWTGAVLCSLAGIAALTIAAICVAGGLYRAVKWLMFEWYGETILPVRILCGFYWHHRGDVEGAKTLFRRQVYEGIDDAYFAPEPGTMYRVNDDGKLVRLEDNAQPTAARGGEGEGNG